MRLQTGIRGIAREQRLRAQKGLRIVRPGGEALLNKPAQAQQDGMVRVEGVAYPRFTLGVDGLDGTTWFGG